MTKVIGTPFPGGPILLYRPMIPVTVEISGRTHEFPAMVDSGADRTIVPGEFLPLLGLTFENLPHSETAPTRGTGEAGPGFTRLCIGTIKWGNVVLVRSFQVAPPSTRPPAVCLGREDFFKNYVVRFNWAKDPPEFFLDPVVRA